jgi:hypothetical protein
MTLKELYEKGIRFHITEEHYQLNGLDISPEQVPLYLENPRLFIAKRHGFETLEAYDKWREWDGGYGFIECLGKTKRGKACKNSFRSKWNYERNEPEYTTCPLHRDQENK